MTVALSLPTRLALALLTAVLLVPLAAPPAEASVTTATIDDLREAERAFVDKINTERANRGQNRLAENLQMARVARGWTTTLVQRDGDLAHNPDFRDQVQGDWQRLGENVGRSRWTGATPADLVDRLHSAFMNSEPHKRNVLGDFNQVGIGVRVDETGRMWVTVNFVKGPENGFPLFGDNVGTAHEGSVNSLWARYVVDGCRDDRYCPGADLTRGEMAKFVAQALRLDPVDANRFADVSGENAGHINALAEAGIVQGCGDDRFCPDERISRGQMSTFLVKASGLQPVSGQLFDDVPASMTHADTINAIAQAKVTVGCGEGRYCPSANVSRGQIASFLQRAAL